MKPRYIRFTSERIKMLEGRAENYIGSRVALVRAENKLSEITQMLAMQGVQLVGMGAGERLGMVVDPSRRVKW